MSAQGGVREARPEDHPAVASLGVDAFAPFGDYRAAMTRWLAQPGLLTLVADDGGVVGFVMVALLDGAGGRVEGTVLAVAVDPTRRSRGLGRALLDAGIGRLEAAAGEWGAQRIHAEVAHDNASALGLFEGAGFSRARTPARASYVSGQRVVRLERPIGTIRAC